MAAGKDATPSDRGVVPAARRLPVGAEIMAGGVAFRVWAPARRRVAVKVEGGSDHSMTAEPNGYFSAFVPGLGAGARYRFRLDGGDVFPDPASRFQPDGPHGPSEVVDPAAYRWRDTAWRGLTRAGQVLYELHVGTFTPEGTYAAALPYLPKLAELGVTAIELMPVAEFPGRFGWGYDGVDLFAPTRLYGRPDDLRRFVDESHRLGLGVILDVVYNHVGPDGNYLTQFAPAYFSDRHRNEWGESLNFDGADAGPVREFFVANAVYWIEEFHFDGLRLDATQAITDGSDEHIVAALTRAARAAAGERALFFVAENEPQHPVFARAPESGGYGVDALWNDDFHHSAMVALTGRQEAYYTDHAGAPQEFVSAAKYGYLFQGQRYAWQESGRGTPALDLAPSQFVTFIQNHDQVANSARGLRVHQLTSAGRARAMTVLLLLLPQTPMLFQGQEFFASAPFFYFADHGDELNRLVLEGRADFLKQFPNLTDEAMAARLALPGDESTFKRSKLDWSEFAAHAEIVVLHRDLLRLRREDPTFAAQPGRDRLDGAVIASEAFLLRYFGDEGEDRLLLVNLGRTLRLWAIPDPLAAPPEGRFWTLLLSSESPDYGGGGAPPDDPRRGWYLPGHAALVFAARTTPPEGVSEFRSGKVD